MDPSPSEAPLSIEPVLGWRVWRLHRRADDGLELRSVTRDDAWPPAEPMRARCATHHGATVPSRGCRCGLYAAASLEDLARAGIFMGGACVIGAIAMWGTVVEHTRGARSRFAYPARLRVVCGPCLASGDGAVDATVVEGGPGPVTAACERHARTLLAPTTPAPQVLQELLATYGVEVMPIERLTREVRTGPASPVLRTLTPLRGPVVVLLSLLRILFGGLFMLWAVFGALTIAAAIVVGAFQAVTQALGLREAPPSPALASPRPELSLPPTPFVPWAEEPPLAVRAPVPAPKIPAFSAVCGRDLGPRIELLRCERGGDLLGFAEHATPSGATRDCVPGWNAYSRGNRFWICWLDLRLPPVVQRHVGAPNPWAVPERGGGAIGGDR